MSSSLGELAEDALTSLTKLTLEFPSLIVQATKGVNLKFFELIQFTLMIAQFTGIDAHQNFLYQFVVVSYH